MTTDPLAFLTAALDAAQRDAEYSRDEFMFFDTGDERVADHYQRAGSPEAVLRRIAADRKMIAEHADDGYGECIRCAGEDGEAETSRGSILHLRTQVPHPCTTIRNMAEGWGWSEETT